MPLDWVDVNEAVSQAKDMICTILVTVHFDGRKTKKYPTPVPVTFLIEIHGIEQMYKLIQFLDKLKDSKKIGRYEAKNLTSFQQIGFDDFKTTMEKLV